MADKSVSSAYKSVSSAGVYIGGKNPQERGAEVGKNSATLTA